MGPRLSNGNDPHTFALRGRCRFQVDLCCGERRAPKPAATGEVLWPKAHKSADGLADRDNPRAHCGSADRPPIRDDSRWDTDRFPAREPRCSPRALIPGKYSATIQTGGGLLRRSRPPTKAGHNADRPLSTFRGTADKGDAGGSV